METVCFTKNEEVITTDNGVIIVGKLNQLPNQASQLYGNNLCHLLDDMGKAENFKIDMEDDVVKRAMVTYNGAINWPPEPLAVSPQKPAADTPQVELKPQPTEAELARKKSIRLGITLGIIGALLIYMGYATGDKDFMAHMTVFALAIFVGWQVIWNVSHSLHTPLMAVTNAISGIIITGGLLQIKDDITSPLSIVAFIAILVASINIVGGFFVTHRMLKMFRK